MPANTLIPEVSYLTVQFFALFKFATRVMVAALKAGCKTGLGVFVALVFSGIGKPKLKVYHWNKFSEIDIEINCYKFPGLKIFSTITINIVKFYS